MSLLLFYVVSLLKVFGAASFDLSMDERIIQCIDWEDKSGPLTTIQLDQKDQNYHICLHTCWNLGYNYMAIKPGCKSTDCVCLENRPSASGECDQKVFDDCANRKSIPVYHSVVSDEDHSIMACLPDSDLERQLGQYKTSYVTSVFQCLEDCNKEPPKGEEVNKVLAGIASGCDRVGQCGKELKCSCVTTSKSVSLMNSPCNEKCTAGRCRRNRYTALYYTDILLHTAPTPDSISLRSIIMISVFSSILIIFLLICIAFVIRSKFRKNVLPFKKSETTNPVDDQGTYRGKPSPSGLASRKIVHPSVPDSPRPTRSAPAPPPPPAFNKPNMSNYSTPHKAPSGSSSPLLKTTRPASKHTYDDAGYVSPTIIKANKHHDHVIKANKAHDYHLMDNDSRTSSFSSIKALFDTPKNEPPAGGKPSPLTSGRNSSSKPSPLTQKHANYDTRYDAKSSLSAPYPPQSSQTSPCYMNTNGFF